MTKNAKNRKQVASIREVRVAIDAALGAVESIQAAVVNGSVDTGLNASLAEAKLALIALDAAAQSLMDRRDTLFVIFCGDDDAASAD